MSIRRSGEFPAITNLLGSAASFVPLHSVVGRSNVAAALPSRLPRLNFMRSHYETLGIPKEASAERIKRLECTPKVRHGIKGPATLKGGQQCWCPDNSIPVN